MIDIEEGPVITLGEARAWLAECGVKVSRPTPWNWCRRGVKGHILDSVIVAGVRYTSVDALRRFLDATNGKREPTPSARRRREIESASRQCDQIFGRRDGA